MKFAVLSRVLSSNPGKIIFKAPFMDSSIDCSINCVKNAIGSSSFTKSGTTVLCNIKLATNTAQPSSSPSILEVYWNEGASRSKNIYFASIIKKILSKMVKDGFDRTFILDLWIGVNRRNALMCSFNAAVLALVDAGVHIENMIYAISLDEEREGVIVFDNDNFMFVHSFGEVKECHIEEACEKLADLKDLMRFKIENKYEFKLQ